MQYGYHIRPQDEDNVIAALEHPDRVCRVRLSVTGSLQLGKMSAVIQEPFPVLTHLSISSKSGTELVLPSGLLGGFAPRLQELDLRGIAVSSLPTLLFRHFCRPVTSPSSSLATDNGLVTFHPMRWLRFWPCYPGSKSLTSVSIPTLTQFPCVP